MPKLTLSLKGLLVATYPLDGPGVVVGSSPKADIHLDSLAVALRHAEIAETDGGYAVRCLDPEFFVTVNDQRVREARLHHGDRFLIGKHLFTYLEDDREAPEPTPSGNEPSPEEQAAAPSPDIAAPERAMLQILNGPRIGRVLVIETFPKRLTDSDQGALTLAREGTDYILTAEATGRKILVDGQPLPESGATLREGAEIQIGPLRLAFFTR